MTASTLTHHTVLADGVRTIGLVHARLSREGGILADPLSFQEDEAPDGTIKTFSGAQKFADLSSPWATYLDQSDWSGGRGGMDFDRDQTKYYDGVGVLTQRGGEIIQAGMPALAKGYRTGAQQWPWQNNTTRGWVMGPIEVNTSATNPYLAVKYAPAANFTAKVLTLVYRVRAAQTATVTVTVCNDNGSGAPGAVQDTITFGLTGKTPYLFYTECLTLPNGDAQTGGTTYWIKINCTVQVYFLAYTQTPLIVNTFYSANGSAWTLHAAELFYQIAPADDHFTPYPFKYKGCQFFAASYDDGGSSQLFIEGDQGLCETTGTTTTSTIVHSNVTWAANEAAGAILMLLRGTGSDQPEPFRKITSNDATGTTGAGQTAFVHDAWDVAPDDTTEFAIVGTDKLTEITSTATPPDWDTPKKITGVLSVNGCVYFCHGDGVALSRLVRYNNAGTWTTTWAVEGDADAKFTHLAYYSDSRGNHILGARGGYPAQVWIADPSDWTAGAGADLAFNLDTNVGDLYEKITGVEIYGEYGAPWILKEGTFHEIYDGKPYRKSPNEMGAASDYRNGQAHLVQGVYLYESFHQTLTRFFNGIMDVVGPTRDEKPFIGNNRGYIAGLAGYPGTVFAALNGGKGGDRGRYSRVIAYNGQGYYTLFKSPNVRLPIRGVWVQPLPGEYNDRLWFVCGSQVWWMPIDLDPFHVDEEFIFGWQGYLQTAYFYAGLNAIPKFFKSIRVTLDNRDDKDVGVSGYGTVRIWYRVDHDRTWTYLGAVTASGGELDFTAANTLSGKRIQLMIGLEPPSGSDLTQRVISTTIEVAVRVPCKNIYTLLVRLRDRDVDVHGNPDDYSATTALAKYNDLDTMRQAATPVAVTSVASPLNNIYAFVDRVRRRPQALTGEDGEEAFLAEVTLIEV